MQSVMEMSIQSFIDEVFKLTYLIAETTEVNANAQNQELLLQNGKSIESNCVYVYKIDKILDLLWLFILPWYMKKDKKFLFCGFLVTTEKTVVISLKYCCYLQVAVAYLLCILYMRILSW